MSVNDYDEMAGFANEQESSELPIKEAPPLPSALQSKVFMFYLLGTIFMIVCAVFAVAYRSIIHPLAFLSGLVLGGFLIFKGVSIKRRWGAGLIEEKTYRCVSCKRFHPISVTSITRISERRFNAYYDIVCTEPEEAESPHLLEFRIGRGGESITLGGLVILYVDVSQPRNPVAWKIL